MKTDNHLETAQNLNKRTERRRKNDWVVRAVNIIAIIGWICAFVAWVLIDQAKPETEDLFSRFFGVSVRGYWDDTLLLIGIIALSVSFLTCVIGFFMNMRRHHRKTDRYNKSIIILGIGTFITLIFFIRMLI